MPLVRTSNRPSSEAPLSAPCLSLSHCHTSNLGRGILRHVLGRGVATTCHLPIWLSYPPLTPRASDHTRNIIASCRLATLASGSSRLSEPAGETQCRPALMQPQSQSVQPVSNSPPQRSSGGREENYRRQCADLCRRHNHSTPLQTYQVHAK